LFYCLTVSVYIYIYFVCVYLSCHTTHTTRAERRARNSAGAEALAVARRPEEASREKKTAAAGIERFFSPERSSRRENNVRASFIISFFFWRPNYMSLHCPNQYVGMVRATTNSKSLVYVEVLVVVVVVVVFFLLLTSPLFCFILEFFITYNSHQKRVSPS